MLGSAVFDVTGGIFANGAATAAFASLIASAASEASTLRQSGNGNAAKGSVRQRQIAARKEVKTLLTDGTLDTNKVFTGDSALSDAATEVLDAVHPISEKYNLEIGGKIVANGEGVSYSSPIVGSPTRVTIDPTGALAGYHTHPGGHPSSAVFSNRFNSRGPGDVGFTRSTGVDLFMSHQPTGTSTVNIRVCGAFHSTCNPNFDPNRIPGFNFGVEGDVVR